MSRVGSADLMIELDTDPSTDTKDRDEVLADPGQCDYGAATRGPFFDNRCQFPHHNCRNTSGQHRPPPLPPYQICDWCRDQVVVIKNMFNPVNRLEKDPLFFPTHYIDDLMRVRSRAQSVHFPTLPDDMPRSKMTRLCEHCEHDEIRHYQLRKGNGAYAAKHPYARDGHNGFQNTCNCLSVFCEAINDACLTCQRYEWRNCFREAGTNLEWLREIARNRNGQRVRASEQLQHLRKAHRANIPCRCGRNTNPIDNFPRTLFCLVCEGVWIDVDQVDAPDLPFTPIIPEEPDHVNRPDFMLGWGINDDWSCDPVDQTWQLRDE